MVEDDGDILFGFVVDFVSDFVEMINVCFDWIIGSEEILVGMLEVGEFDVLVGGFID